MPRWQSYIATTTGAMFTPEQCKLIIQAGHRHKPEQAKVGGVTKKTARARGGGRKNRLLRVENVSLTNPKSGKSSSTKIIEVVENSANPNYVRQNIITKGSIIETEKGKAKVTSRPGQHGVVNAVLIVD